MRKGKETLMADQMIFKRCEIKYMLDITQAELLKNQMKQYMTADEHGMSTICSLYFDTPDYLLIQRSMEHLVYKEKLRLRSYGMADKDTTVFVELKKKYESVVYKRRIAMTEDEAERYLLFHEKVKDTQITREIDYCLKNYKKLAPAVMLSYGERSFLCEGRSRSSGSRLIRTFSGEITTFLFVKEFTEKQF